MTTETQQAKFDEFYEVLTTLGIPYDSNAARPSQAYFCSKNTADYEEEFRIVHTNGRCIDERKESILSAVNDDPGEPADCPEAGESSNSFNSDSLEEKIRKIDLCLSYQHPDVVPKGANAGSRDYWLGNLMAIKNEAGESGYQIAKNWTSQSKFHQENPEEFDQVWKSISERQEGGKTLGTLAFNAIQNGMDKSLLSPQKRYLLSANQMTAADLLEQELKDRLKLVDGNKWMSADPETNIWGEDDNYRYRVLEGLLNEGRQLCYELKDSENEDEQKKGKDGLKALDKLSRATEQDGVMKILSHRDGISAKSSDFDNDPRLLGVKNGVIELGEKCVFRQAKVEDMVSRTCVCDYAPDATAPVFRKAYAEIIPNEEKAHHIHKSLGYGATGINNEKKMYVWHGPGDDGKTTLAKINDYVLNDYSVTLPSIAFTVAGRYKQDEVMATSEKTRTASIHEFLNDVQIDAPFTKQFSGNDPMSVRNLYETRRDIAQLPKAKILCNNLPQTPGNDPTAVNRFELHEFEIQFKGSDADKDLEEKLKAEVSGILNFILEGVEYYFKEGLNPPQCVIDDTKKFQRSSNTFNNFIDEWLKTDENSNVTQQDIYKAYRYWCAINGIKKPMSSISLGKELDRLGYTRDKTEFGQMVFGVSLKQELSLSELIKYGIE